MDSRHFVQPRPSTYRNINKCCVAATRTNRVEDKITMIGVLEVALVMMAEGGVVDSDDGRF